MAIYPTAIPNTTNYPNRADDVDWIYAARYNEIKNEVIALCKELGISPSGGSDTLVLRLATLALKSNVLALDNTDPFTPDADYEPATKKYVDENIGVGDKIEEGDSSVEVIDTGEGHVDIKTDNVLVGKFHPDGIVDLPQQSGCFAYLDTTLDFNQNVWTIVLYDTGVYDLRNELDIITNKGRFTATKAGTYLVTTGVLAEGGAAGELIAGMIYKNGAQYINTLSSAYATTSTEIFLTTSLIKLAVNDFIDFRFKNYSAPDSILISSKSSILIIQKVA